MTRGGRAARQRTLLQLIQKETWSNQQVLSEALEKQGYPVSQATLSRDLREIGVVRVASSAGSHYSLPGDEPIPRGPDLLAFEVTEVASNETTVLIRTWPGRAQGVAMALDHMAIPEIMGTVAGDDTVLIVPTSVKKTKALQKRLEAALLSPRG